MLLTSGWLACNLTGHCFNSLSHVTVGLLGLEMNPPHLAFYISSKRSELGFSGLDDKYFYQMNHLLRSYTNHAFGRIVSIYSDDTVIILLSVL